MQNKTVSRRIFEVFNAAFMLLMVFAMLYPLLFVVNASFSGSDALLRHGNGLLLMPIEPTLNAYKMTLSNNLIISGYLNTIFVVAVGTFVNIIMTSMLAYPLSIKNMMIKKPLMKFVMVTMFFGGGLIPTYLVVREIKLIDSIWSLIIPSAISTYNMIILRTGFEGVPDSLRESALIDGAGHMRILFQIIFPLAKATVAVICLYYGVAHWNAWFEASIYLQKDNSKWPLQLVLRQILMMNDVNSMAATGETMMDQQNNVAESIKYATIVVATVPVLCIYPFIQKYFTKGVMIGAVKG